MNWLKRKLRGWLMPEYDQWWYSKEKFDLFMEEVARAIGETKLTVGKDITFEKPVVFLGSLKDCKVDVKPTIKPEIILAKLDIPAGLMTSGNHQLVTGCVFHQEPTVIKVQEK